jgi:hypothetical protein
MPFSSTSGAQTRRKVIKTVSANANNYVLKTEIGTFTDSIDAIWQNQSGIVIGDSGNLGYAANTGTNWPTGSVVYFTNNGTIQGSTGTTGPTGSNGAGGNGGPGDRYGNPTSGMNGSGGSAGSPGSPGGSGGTTLIFGVKTIVYNNGTINGGPGGPGGPGGAGGGGGGGGGAAWN